jgi:hypothetical protein
LNLQVLDNNIATRVEITGALKFENCHFTVTATSPSCLARLRFGLQFLGLAQKDSLLLVMIYYLLFLLDSLQSFHVLYTKYLFWNMLLKKNPAE